jgi:YidC/Oxa1 family membrane protein insertase
LSSVDSTIQIDSVSPERKQAIIDSVTAAQAATISAADAKDYGSLTAATQGEETSFVLENDLMKVTFSNKGGKVTQVILKNLKLWWRTAGVSWW